MKLRFRQRMIAPVLALAIVAGGGTALAAGDTRAPDEVRKMLASEVLSGAPVSPDQPVARDGIDLPAADTGQDQLAGASAVEEYARTKLADTFAGVYLTGTSDGDTATLVVAVTETPGPDDEREMRALAGSLELTFQLVDYSLAELQAKQREIEQHMADLERQGVEIAYIGVDVMANRVTVAVTNDVAGAEAILANQFGSEMLEVIQQERPQLMPGASDVEIDPGRKGLLQRILDWFRSLVSRWFN